MRHRTKIILVPYFSRTFVLLSFLSCFLGISACESKVDVSTRHGSALLGTDSVTKKSSLTEDIVLENENAKITVPAGSFAIQAQITLSSMSKTAFLEKTGLAADTIIPAGPVQMISNLTGTSTAADPYMSIQFKINVPVGGVIEDDTVAVVVVSGTDGKDHVYYIEHSNLSFATDATTGLSYTVIPKIESGNFAVALVSGLNKTTLDEKFTVFPEDGKVNPVTPTPTPDSTPSIATVPTHGAVGLSLSDTDSDGLEIGGTLNITKATNETDVTHYVVYWGASASLKQNATPIATIAATGSNLSYVFANNTAIPTGPAATHILVYTKNAVGEMATGTAFLIVDLGVPTHAAASVAFTDTDNDSAQLGGTINITKAADESDVTDYVLYWGSNATTKQNATPIANVAATGANVTYNLAANTAIPTSPTATHVLVFTKNADGEMATGASVAIVDTSVPIHAAAGIAFTDSDTDAGEIAGNVTITTATSEADVTHYVLYWGSDATTKQNATPIATIAVTGSDVTHTFGANTAIPTSPTATHLLVYTKNAVGEMSTGASLAIADSGAILSVSSYATTVANVGSSLAWVTISEATGAPNASASTVTNATGPGATTDLLQLTGYDFSAVPVGATIVGFVVGITEQSVFMNSVSDHTVSLMKAGSVVGSPVTEPTAWPTSYAVVNRGSNSNLWGTTWTRADILDANFGVSIRAVFAGNGGGYVDAVRVTVYYTP